MKYLRFKVILKCCKTDWYSPSRFLSFAKRGWLLQVGSQDSLVAITTGGLDNLNQPDKPSVGVSSGYRYVILDLAAYDQKTLSLLLQVIILDIVQRKKCHWSHIPKNNLEPFSWIEENLLFRGNQAQATCRHSYKMAPDSANVLTLGP